MNGRRKRKKGCGFSGDYGAKVSGSSELADVDVTSQERYHGYTIAGNCEGVFVAMCVRTGQINGSLFVSSVCRC